MRLLKCDDQGELSLTEHHQDDLPPYAILSHTWADDKDEVHFDDVQNGCYKSKAGYAKIRFCGEQTKKDKLRWFWVDTCCINKANHTELSEAITSMFRWYRNAVKCYVYLADVAVRGDDDEYPKRTWKLDFQKSRWFKRSWTLQELIAPVVVEFFSREEERLGNKSTLETQIQEITGIPSAALRGAPVSEFSYEERMRWAVHRNTKKKEDRAYCLLGIFDIFMPLIYGEGDNAFARLKKEIGQSPHGTRFSGPSAPDVFNGAIKSFRNNLSPGTVELFQRFLNPQMMLESLRSHCDQLQNERKVFALCNRLFKIASSLEPFFETVTVLVQSSPDWARSAWGALHLVFVLSSRHPTMLEKLATMLEQLVQRLPAYTEYLKSIQERQDKPAGATADTSIRDRSRLAISLSYVYVDIIQFCQSACKMFVSKADPIQREHRVIRELFWTPFDTRFYNMLDRLRAHEELFSAEIRLEQQKAQEYRYRNMNPGSEEQIKIAQSIEGAVRELQIQISESEAKICQQFNEFVHSITDPESYNQLGHGALAKKEEEVRRDRIQELRRWINSPEYMKEYERARSFRHPETAAWISRTKEYVRWYDVDLFCRSGNSDIHSSLPLIPFRERALSIQAKPGFGKTVLSSFIIEDLELFASSLLGSPRAPRNVVFFHFTKSQFNTTDPGQAFRAILTQLLHKNQRNRDAIDALSLLMDVDGNDQSSATDEEVDQALAYSIQLLPGCYFVFDGVDECLRPTEFLNRLYHHCNQSHSKVVFLHRPNLRLPEAWEDCQKVLLNQTLNLTDIRQYLSTEVSRFSRPSKILAGTSESYFVESLTLRANGMFLWAKLILQYLQCPALTQSERLKCIEETNMVEGIEELYSAILKEVDTRYRKEKDLVFRMLRIVSVAVRPLTLSEIKYAVAIRAGHVTSAAHQIADLESSWVFLCGSLLEQRDDNTMGFIHSSVPEFLESAETASMDWHIDRGLSHADLSNVCLSYLLFDMPASMLSGQVGTKASVANLKETFTFLEYALSWVKHGECYLEHVSSLPHQDQDTSPYNNLISTIEKLTSWRLAASSWIEATWTFGMRPRLRNLWEGLTKLSSSFAIVNADTTKTLERLGEFAQDLDLLAEEWWHVLKFYPHEIWGESITAFSKSQFWYETKDTEVTRFRAYKFSSAAGLNEMVEDSQIVIASQVSDDSRYLGLISVHPPEDYVRFSRRYAANVVDSKSLKTAFLKVPVLSRSANRLFQGWTARVKVWTLEEKSPLFDLQILLPPGEIQNILNPSLTSQCPWRFSFPAAFSPDLRRILILGTVSQISRSSPGPGQMHIYLCRTQVLSTKDKQVIKENHVQSFTTMEPFFSPDGLSVALLESQGDVDARNTSTIRPRTLSVWRQSATSTTQPEFLYIGQHLVNNAASRGLNNFRRSVAFHPDLPFIAFPQWDRTSLWYLQRNVQPDIVAKQSLQDLKFINGMCLTGVARMLTPATNSIDSGGDGEGSLADLATEIPIRHALSKYLTQGQMKRYLESIRRDPEFPDYPSLFFVVDGSAALTKNDPLDGQLSALGRHGPCQTYLPLQQTSSAASVTSIPPTDTTTRMVWNKGFQASYSILDPPERHFPSMVERRTDTIRDCEKTQQGITTQIRIETQQYLDEALEPGKSFWLVM